MARSTFLLLCLCLGLITTLPARHIIGGSMSYRCLGKDEYEFTLRMYRDCNCIGCPPLDATAYIGIYRCASPASCGAQFNAYASLDVPRQSIGRIAPPEYPCLVPPDVCVEEGIFVFRYTLPLSSSSYQVSFQRCCRDETMSNILSPGGTGVTYTIEITPEAQRLCNSSPSFAVVPPTVICANATLEYEHKAEEMDGDSLVYELCAPLAGAGNQGQGQNAFICTGTTPRPACPPPYAELNYRQPYSASFPIPGSPALSINAKTGLITLRPTALGRFAVGVCVLEYRKGVLLSKLYRDFQFNITDGCSPKLAPRVKADQKLADKEFLVRACGNTLVPLVNESTPPESIKFVQWEFNLKNGRSAKSGFWNAEIQFPDTGRYLGKLLLNPGYECVDSAKVWVHVLPLLQADFTYQYDSCKAGAVQFQDRSIAHSKFIRQWNWSLDEYGANSRLPSPSFRYQYPGLKQVRLTVRDTNGCISAISKGLRYFPAPPILLVAPNVAEQCEPAQVIFHNHSSPIDSTYRIEWSFGDGGSSKRISPVYLYKNDGLYSVGLKVTSTIGCQVDTVFKNLVRIKPRPKSAFTIEPPEVSNVFPDFQLRDQSAEAVRWLWQLGDGRQYTDRNLGTSARGLGSLRITQFAYNNFGCSDSSSQTLLVLPEVRYFLPNAFTPNGDSVNDELQGVGIFEGMRNFSIQVWNRWGELVFQSKNPQEGWNGQKFNQGTSLPVGVYTVLATYLDPKDKVVEYRGFVTLLR
jgi:gliding motility-associated-like protein